MTVQRLDRRRLLAGALAIPAAIVVAAPPALAGGHPDAELLELGRQHTEVQRRYTEVADQAALVSERAQAAHPPMSEVLRKRQDDWFISRLGVGQFYTSDEVARWRTGIEREDYGLAAIQLTRLRTRGREIVAAWDAHLAAIEAVNVAYGARQLERAADDLGDAYYDLERQIFEMKATTPDGWRLKARITAHIIQGQEDGTYEDMLVRNLLTDVLRGAPQTR
jgi:hypothetical protein